MKKATTPFHLNLALRAIFFEVERIPIDICHVENGIFTEIKMPQTKQT